VNLVMEVGQVTTERMQMQDRTESAGERVR
jgi:hypothetical protein